MARSDHRVLLVADTAFIEPETVTRHNLLSVFPRDAGDGAYRASLDMLLRRSELQSAYYDELLPMIIPAFGAAMPGAGTEVGRLVRPVLVTVTSLFVDRSIRVLHRMRQQNDMQVSVVGVKPLPDVRWLSEIRDTPSVSWHLNQDVIQRIAVALGLERVRVFEEAGYPEYPSEHRQRNLSFLPQRPSLAGILIAISSRYYNLLGRLSNRKARFQGVVFATERHYLLKRGLLGPFGIFRKDMPLELDSGVRDPALRKRLLAELSDVVKPRCAALFFRVDPDIQPGELTRLSQAYVELLVDWFPSGFLEGLPSNLAKAEASLDAGNIVGIIGPDMVSGRGYILGTSARLAGKTVIGIQHGGHYGYIQDHSLSAQAEYAFYDKLITWGWTQIDPHLPQCETVPLPSPKLSEQPLKARYSAAPKKPGDRATDILFLSNTFHRFPHISTCGQARVDFIDEITASQETLMKALADAGLTVDHKPYSMKYVDLYPDHFRRLEVAGGKGYRLLKSTHKGLTVDMIRRRRIVLWDQIGTGTLECFTSGVPTIVYWKRIYSREATFAAELVADLERTGVVHTESSALAKEVGTYLSDPGAWMADPRRARAIGAFCEKYALTDARWSDSWRRQIQQWSAA